MASGRQNLEWAAALVDELVRAGIEWFMVAPGSRSTPLVLAAHAHPHARTVVHLDERSAAFFALGVGKATGRPAAVVTTSGTATANLLPACVEAAQSESPLVLLTADRPTQLLGGDANQAIDQTNLYGRYPKASFDTGAVSAAPDSLRHLRQVGSRAAQTASAHPHGPVHVNVPFSKPLQPDEDVASLDFDGFAEGRPEGRPYTVVDDMPGRPGVAAIEGAVAVLSAARRPLIVAGPSSVDATAATAARRLSSLWGVPLVTDPLSGARFVSSDGGQALTVDYADAFLADAKVAEALRPDAVIRFGRSPTSARVNALCVSAARQGAPVVVFDAGGRWKDHRATVTHVVGGDPGSAIDALTTAHPALPALDTQWAALWNAASRAAHESLVARAADPDFEGAVAWSAARAIPEGGAFFISSSMPIRDVDAFVTPREFTGRAFGNRGASGIDGIASTALGTAAATDAPTLCLIGDIAFLHDIGGLLAARSVEAPVVFVVVNNDGGGIFHLLPIREHGSTFTKYFATPHGLDLSHAAALYGLPHSLVSPGELEVKARDAFASGGTHILEVRTDRERNAASRAEVVGAIGKAVAAALGL